VLTYTLVVEMLRAHVPAPASTCRGGAVGQEALEVVDGREAGLGIVEGQEFTVHGAPAAARGAVLPGLGVCGACDELRGQARLCSHVGERVGGAVGQDVRLGHLQDRDAGGQLVQAAPDDRLLHAEDAPAEPLVVPVAPLEGPVDEESQEPGRVLLRWFIGVYG